MTANSINGTRGEGRSVARCEFALGYCLVIIQTL